MAKDLFPDEGENREAIQFLEQKIAKHLDEIKTYYSETPKITLIVRCPWIVDADFIMSNDDDPQAVCNSLMNLYRRSHPEK